MGRNASSPDWKSFVPLVPYGVEKYFGYEGVLNPNTAEEVWNLCNEKLKTMSVRDMILQSHVKTICTTDDPADSLIWHEEIAHSDFPVTVLPAWRPDRLLHIGQEGFAPYIQKLALAAQIEIENFSDFKKAVLSRMDFLTDMDAKSATTAFLILCMFLTNRKKFT